MRIRTLSLLSPALALLLGLACGRVRVPAVASSTPPTPPGL